MRWFLVLATIVGGAAGAGWYYRKELSDLLATSPSPTYIVEPVAHSPGEVKWMHAVGYVEGATESAELRFEVAGRLQKILVKEGQTVKAGDVLAELDAALQAQQVIQAESQLELTKAEYERLKNAARPETRQVALAQVQVAQAELNHLQDEADRMKRLYEKGTATEKEWKDAFHPAQIAKARLLEKQALAGEVEAPTREDDLQVAQSKIDVAQADLRHARLSLDKTKLLAPSDGTVLHIGGEVGNLLGLMDSHPLMLFANLDTLRIRAYIEELHALKVAPGAAAEVTVDGLPNQTFSGSVVFCSPWMDEKQHRTHKPSELFDIRTREVIIELKEAKELVVGLPVEVRIESRSMAELSIPPGNSNLDSGERQQDPDTPMTVTTKTNAESPEYDATSEPINRQAEQPRIQHVTE